MDTIILRIYRRSAERPGDIIGVSEHVETGEKKRFENIQQLSGIILHSQSEPQQRKKHPANKDTGTAGGSIPNPTI